VTTSRCSQIALLLYEHKPEIRLNQAIILDHLSLTLGFNLLFLLAVYAHVRVTHRYIIDVGTYAYAAKPFFVVRLSMLRPCAGLVHAC